MAEYAWRQGAWKGGAIKLGSWGPEAGGEGGGSPAPGLPSISGGSSGLRFATFDAMGLGGGRKNLGLSAYGKKRRT